MTELTNKTKFTLEFHLAVSNSKCISKIRKVCPGETLKTRNDVDIIEVFVVE